MRRWHRHRGPPPFVRRMGCLFAALIVLAAAGGSTLVSMITRTPQRGFMIAGIAVGIAVTLVAGFAFSIRRVAGAFAEENRRRRQLMADVGHELRTPLAILQGRIEGLLDGVYPRDDQHLGELLSETRHLSRLVDDVRTLATADAGALDLRKELVDPAELVRDAASSISSRVSVDVKGELPLIEVDPVRIREVLLNLLTNALEHAPEGTVAIRAEARPNAVVIRVSDNGRGIPAEELPRVFDRFRKGPHSRGTGLGMSIARKLVLAHQGDIQVESAEGAGTTVTVSLPA